LKDGPENVSESRARKRGSRCHDDDDNRALSQSSRSHPLRKQIFSLQPTPNSPTSTQYHSNKTSAVNTAHFHTTLRSTTKGANYSTPVLIKSKRQTDTAFTHKAPRDTIASAMADSNVSGASRKRAKVSDQSPICGKKTDVRAVKGVSFGAAQKKLDHQKKQVSSGKQLTI
jgi:hypothetical protein